jgi:hypothetical protein
MSEYLVYTYTTIINNEMKELKKCLDLYRRANLEESELHSLISLLIDTCQKSGNTDAVKTILDTFTIRGLGEEETELYPTLFMRMEYTNEMLAFMASALSEETQEDMMRDLVSGYEMPDLPVGLRRICEVYGNPPYDMISNLYQIAETSGNDYALNFLASKLLEFKEPAKIPPHIILIDKDKIPSHSELMEALDKKNKHLPEPDISSLTVPEILDIVLGGLDFLGRNDEKEVAQKMFLSLTKKEQKDIVKPLLQRQAQEELADDETLFTVLGPSHPFSNDDLSTESKDVCSKYGGHRMLVCNCFNRYDSERDVFDADIDWFDDESCDYCMRHIQGRHCALRRPNPEGGWVGSYCCQLCLNSDLEKNVFEGKPDAYLIEMVKALDKQLNNIGIIDRRYD